MSRFDIFVEPAKFDSCAQKGREDIVVERGGLRRRGKEGKKNVLYCTTPGRRFRSAARCSLEIATHVIVVEKVTRQSRYSAKCVLSLSRMRNARWLLSGAGGPFNTFEIL